MPLICSLQPLRSALDNSSTPVSGQVRHSSFCRRTEGKSASGVTSPASHLELAVLLSPFLQSWLLRVGGPRGCQVLGPASPLQGRDCPLGSLGLCLLTLASGPLVTRLETLQPAGTSAVSIVCPFAHPHLCHTLPVLASHLELAVLLFLPFHNLGF